jgi:hypothetical protein
MEVHSPRSVRLHGRVVEEFVHPLLSSVTPTQSMRLSC